MLLLKDLCSAALTWCKTTHVCVTAIYFVCYVQVSWSPMCFCRKTTKENIKEKKKVKEDKNGSKLQTVSKSWIATDYLWAGADTYVRTEKQKNEDSGKGEERKVFLMFPPGWGWMLTCKKVSTEIPVEDSWVLLIEAEECVLAVNALCFWTVVQK